ncbi:adenosylcobinamide-GDP ribazoletransferase [Methylococcus mesophilus]|uniref:adenosylcobinamide-GDP ribazoletransferase n=1 Tax=Methylococcus mesophilus TaxID=2993564 RepID=UPI00224B1AE1|nr:adenosylcobinamide-GDP ribazoletransferase [Methylococcus mesophilus]UZR30874.1 adenosylcobinamide-GDP ribazoletransferase [Methylococcus mesophilus]
MNLSPFWLAVQFLTRLPVPRAVDFSPRALGRSVVFYPAVGLLIGAILLAARLLLQDAGPALASALVLLLWVLVTGGLHIDGLADSADAWVGGHGDAERSLEIMKDPRSGPIAVAVVVLLLLVKFGALVDLSGRFTWLPLLVAPAAARGLVPALLLTTPYVRKGGLGGPLAENLPRRPALFAVLFAAAMLAALGPWPLLAVAAAAWTLRAMMLRRLGGCTGDTLGASIEIAEAAVLVAAALA